MRGLAVVLAVGLSGVAADAADVFVDGRPAPALSAHDAPAVPRVTSPPFTVGADAAADAARARIEQLGVPRRIVVATPTPTYYRRPSDAVLAPAWVVDIATGSPWGVWRVFVSGE